MINFISDLIVSSKEFNINISQDKFHLEEFHMFNCFRCLILGMYAINLVGEPISVFLIAKRGYVCIMTNMFFLLYISFSRLNTGCLISMSSGTTSIRKTTVVAISIKFISILVRYEQFVSSLIPCFKFLKYKC